MTTPSEQSYRTIPLTQGQFALVDEADYESLAVFKWHAIWNINTKSFYAVRNGNKIIYLYASRHFGARIRRQETCG
jgi:hypothetical protein